ncbi:hypothetical protein HIM_12259 [Hirsutella minnesotensis 3608]|uniref:Uncharacterized protein n=2 Tax=Hirsutella minnesotensis 3608 TaxID=1043627 RepID=A0A0F7ZI85_9HYPO|nr:hypothetical protein HIM_12259 [Hirsutella minnesotensis 3608]
MTSRICPLRHSELIHKVAAQAARIETAETSQPIITTSRHAVVEEAHRNQETGEAALATQDATIGDTTQFTEVAENTEATSIEEDAGPAPPTRCATIDETVASAQPTDATQTATVEEAALTAEKLRYDDPRAIYQRHVKAREAWYKAQPRSSIKTNQAYCKAIGLPQRYDKQSFEWCLDYKQMSALCVTSTGRRSWTKEEQMACLDWSQAEDERVQAQVAKEMGDDPLGNVRKGVKEIWRRVEENSREQDALHSGADGGDSCIFVQT